MCPRYTASQLAAQHPRLVDAVLGVSRPIGWVERVVVTMPAAGGFGGAACRKCAPVSARCAMRRHGSPWSAKNRAQDRPRARYQRHNSARLLWMERRTGLSVRLVASCSARLRSASVWRMRRCARLSAPAAALNSRPTGAAGGARVDVSRRVTGCATVKPA